MEDKGAITFTDKSGLRKVTRVLSDRQAQFLTQFPNGGSLYVNQSVDDADRTCFMLVGMDLSNDPYCDILENSLKDAGVPYFKAFSHLGVIENFTTVVLYGPPDKLENILVTLSIQFKDKTWCSAIYEKLFGIKSPEWRIYP